MRVLIILCVFCLGLASFNVLAIDDADERALADTEALLKSQNLRFNDAKANPDSAAVQEKIRALAKQTGAKEEDIYALSADVFREIAAETNGDPAAIQKLLEDAQKNPEVFVQSWQSKNQQKLRDIANVKNNEKK